MDNDTTMPRVEPEPKVLRHLRGLIAAARPGDRLPSVRALMAELRVSPATVQQAILQLSGEGAVEARPGNGTFVMGRPASPPAPADIGWQSLTLGQGRQARTEALDDFGSLPKPTDIVLNAGYPPEDLQPIAALGKASIRAARRPDVWARLPIEGVPELRSWFAAETRHIFETHEVLICPGTQAALCAGFRALAAPGDTILMESPTYAGAIAAAQSIGLRIVPVPTDTQGVNVTLLDEAFAKTGARLFYTQPAYANPTGAVLADNRRAAVLDILRRRGAFVIEDDWARDFQLDSTPIPAPLARNDPSGHVVYIRSLTKCSAPGLRVGALCARGAGFARLRQARLIDDFFVPGILQYTVLELVNAPTWRGHLRSTRAALRERRDSLVVALKDNLGADCLPLIPSGGLHLWVELPPGVSDQAVYALAAQRGVLVSPGSLWFPGEPIGGFLRISFTAARPEMARDGIHRIAEIIASLRA